jgi:hypothetical protein
MKIIRYKTHLFFVGLLIMIYLINLKGIFDPDFFWHLSLGEYMVDKFSIPTFDVLTWYGVENSLFFLPQEWLAQVFLFGLYKFLGFWGIIFVPLLFLISIFYFTIKIWIKKIENLDISILTLLFALAFLLNFYQAPRPAIFSILLFSIELFLLRCFILKKKIKYLVFIPFLSVLWSNLHGGSSPLAYILPLIFITGFLFDLNIGKFYSKRNKWIVKKLLIISFFSILGILINPNGLKILLFPYFFMFNSKMLSFVSEWNSINFHDMWTLIFLITLIIPILALINTSKRIRSHDAILFFLFLYQALKYTRFIGFYIIVATGIFFIYRTKQRPIIRLNFKNAPLYVFFGMIPFMLILFGLKISYFNANEFVDKLYFPTNAISIIQEEKPSRIYNEYHWGGFLSWNLRKEGIKAFIDGRAEIFEDTIFYESISVTHGLNIDEIFKKHNFDLAVVSKETPIFYTLNKNPLWEIKHEDDVCVVFVQNFKNEEVFR